MLVIVEECAARGCERDVDMTREGDGDPYGMSADARFCSDDCRDNAAERAYESAMADYYGGSGPMSMGEQLRAAYAMKEGRS